MYMRKHYKQLNFCNFRRKLLLIAVLLCIGLMQSVYAQKSYTYTGVVSDNTGESMPGVNVLIKGTNNGTSTNLDGAFTLTSSNATETLVFSFIGTESQEVTTAAGIKMKITMVSKSTGLQEVVVVGYGTQKKSVVTGSITSVKAKDLEKHSIERVDQALQGRTSGVLVTSSSGSPGSASTIRIRGTTTINNSDPLFVVDGVVVDNGGIDYLNTADIQSIEVLKDAASQAIYGTSAANGVILITTKKGQSGRVQVNYNTYFGIQAPAKKLSMLNATEYATLQNESYEAAGLPKPFANPESFGVGTDWQDAIFNNSASIQNHELSVSGGNEKTTFYTSFGYLNQEGIVTTDISNYKRLNLRLNATYKAKDWMNMGVNFGYSHIKSQGSLNTNSEYGGPLASAINLDPITPIVETDPDILSQYPYTQENIILDENGNPYGISTRVAQEMTNPLAYAKTKHGNFGSSDNMVGNAFVEIEPIKRLKFKSDLGGKLAFWGGESFNPVYWLNAASFSTVNSYNRESNTGLNWNFENTLTYIYTLENHHFVGMLGTGAYVSSSQGLGVSYQNLPVTTFEDASMNYNLNADNINAWGWEDVGSKKSSTFFRLNYDFKEKYLFTGIIRRDGSSKFGRNYKFGYFPSVSFGWNVTKEDFWPRNNVVDQLKVRGSYGIVGNDRIANFLYVSTVGGGRNYTFGNDNYVIGYSPNAPENPDLRWEQTKSANFGFEATVLENITVVFDLFSKNTEGMLYSKKIPDYIGAAGNPTANILSMVNKGVELEVGYRKNLGPFDFDLKGNVTYLQNEITDLAGVESLGGSSFQSSSYQITRSEEGVAFNSFYGFEALGIFQNVAEVKHHRSSDGTIIQPDAQPGDLMFADVNDDGKIDADDRKFIGDPTPNWNFGFTFSIKYKAFDALIFGQGVAGNQIFNAMRRLDIKTANWTSDALDRWTAENPSDTYPRLDSDDPNHNFSYPSSFFLSNGSYMRIKTFQIGYTVPRAIVQRIGIENLRAYVSSNNLLTLTKYNGFDPEIGGGSYGIDRGVYPQARSFMFGINLGL